MFITGVNDTGDKVFTGVNDTGDKVFTGVNDTGDKFNPCHRFSVIGGVVDNGDKFIAGDPDPEHCHQGQFICPMSSVQSSNLD
jgi:hypothetical protein